MTKEKAIANARYMIKHTFKRAFIFNTGYRGWCFTTNSKEAAQAEFHDRLQEYQEVKLE